MLSHISRAIVPLALLGGMSAAGQAPASPDQAPTFAIWSERVDAALNDHLEYPSPWFREGLPHGIVRVKFNCSDSGAPASVAILRSSGSARLDAAALHAVKRIATLHPLPAGMRHDQKYEAAILFAEDEASFRRQLAKLAEESSTRNKWFGHGEQTAALVLTAGVAGGR